MMPLQFLSSAHLHFHEIYIIKHYAESGVHTRTSQLQKCWMATRGVDSKDAKKNQWKDQG